jgi:hypothetical protein
VFCAACDKNRPSGCTQRGESVHVHPIARSAPRDVRLVQDADVADIVVSWSHTVRARATNCEEFVLERLVLRRTAGPASVRTSGWASGRAGTRARACARPVRHAAGAAPGRRFRRPNALFPRGVSSCPGPQRGSTWSSGGGRRPGRSPDGAPRRDVRRSPAGTTRRGTRTRTGARPDGGRAHGAGPHPRHARDLRAEHFGGILGPRAWLGGLAAPADLRPRVSSPP